MDELARLELGSFCNGRVAMAEIRNADAAGEVEEASATHHSDIAAGATLDDFRCQPADASGYMLGAELSERRGGHIGGVYSDRLQALTLYVKMASDKIDF